jgi:hypothetical protein
MRELDFVSRIFHGSKDQRGMKLFWKCDDLKEKLKSRKMEAKAACRAILLVFQGIKFLVYLQIVVFQYLP